MFRLLRVMWYFCTGRFSAAADAWQSNKFVMSETYDRSIAKSQARFQQVKEAVASLIAIREQKVVDIKELSSRVERLAKIKAGAAQKARTLSQELMSQGKSKAEIENHPDILRHMGAYNDAASSLAETDERIKEKESDMAEKDKLINQYKTELLNMQRVQEKLRTEKHEAIADVGLAQQAQAVNDMLNGIAEDTTDKDLQAARELRKKAVANAKVTAELAGNDAKLAENEYVAYAADVESKGEFLSLLGLPEDKEEEKVGEPAKLPE